MHGESHLDRADFAATLARYNAMKLHVHDDYIPRYVESQWMRYLPVADIVIDCIEEQLDKFNWVTHASPNGKDGG